ncbi:MAG: pilus assembly protein PilP [Myxococcota bacterium]|nr:pilus assembly protein PilP [Myxococcota bacterium]
MTGLYRRVLATALPIALAACGNPTSSAPPPPVRLAPMAAATVAPLSPELKGPEYAESDFVEGDRNRDPFRTFIIQNQIVSTQALNQRKVELAAYAIDELKLVAIILGGDRSRAMFVDPTGKGTVVYRGTFICRSEVVHLGGSNGPEYQLNWRVDRIREGDVVLIREDPAQPAIPPATRVVPLHPETNNEAQGLAHG